VDHIFTLEDEPQLQASAIMAQYGLDDDSRENIANRWSQQWSRHSEKAEIDIQKLLYLCACGYDHRQRNTKYDHTETERGPGSQQRHTGAPFTGCLAHVELTVRGNKILRIRGHFEHNEGCKTALFERIPPIPVHPSVYIAALAQLRDGASFSDIRRKNRELFEAKAYKDFPDDITALCGTTGAVRFFLFWQVFARTAALSSIFNRFPSKWAHSIRVENPQRMECRYF
jgi:hypothetical protein